MMIWVLRILGAILILGFFLCAFSPLPNVAANSLAAVRDAVPSGAIVVLGADVRQDGVLGDSSLRRAVAGIEEFKAGRAPLLVMLGSTRQGSHSEADVRARLARTMGVPAEAVLTDDQARTTREEAQRTALLLKPTGVSTIILVSDALHLDRARRVFEQQGFRVTVAPANAITLDAATPELRMNLARFTAQQAVAWLVYRITG